MKTNITEEALGIIRARKKKNQEDFRKKTAILDQDKQFVETERKYIDTVIENRKKEAYGQACDHTTEAKYFEQLQSIKAKYGLENATMHFDCPICKDTGYVDGKQCSCLKSIISNLLLKGSGFEQLEDFESATKTAKELKPLYKSMKEWCNSNSAKNLIYLCGPTGVGKTHLIRCMANEFISNGKVVNIVTSLDMSIDFKTFSKNSDEELLKKYITPEVLFVDDLGAEPIFKNVTVEYLYLIINERKMRNRKTIITSNLELDEISDRYDERLYSRIGDQKTSIYVILDGEDRRGEKK